MVKILLALSLLFLTGCFEESNAKPPKETSVIKKECKNNTNVLENFCKLTNKAGESTCVAYKGSKSSYAIPCSFYDGV